MARALGLCGMTGGFLMISPNLRQTLIDLTNNGLAMVQQYSPYSYIGVVLVVFGGVSITLITGSNPR